MRQRSAFTLTELLVLIMIAMFLFGVAVVAADEENDKENRQKCASNLRQIGQAMLLYSNENKGAFPRVRYDPKVGKVKAYTNSKCEDPFKDGGPEANDVTASFALLIRTEEIEQSSFICPSSDATANDFVMKELWNFPGRKNLSYSYANPYPSRAAVKAGYKLNNALPAAFAVCADMNPGGEALLKINTDTGADDLKPANSKNHGGDGQNVLYADGHVEWTATPLCGVDQDNIYTYGKSGKDADKGGDGINGSPIGPGDSVLLPSADMTGEADAKKE
jgi:prepilin-type processing-associated H-X9-DG protein